MFGISLVELLVLVALLVLVVALAVGLVWYFGRRKK